MKTKITIEIETQLNKVVDNDQQDITQEASNEFHEIIYSMIKQTIEEDIEDKFFEHADEQSFIEGFGIIPVEGWERINDYGEIKIHIEQEKTSAGETLHFHLAGENNENP